MQNKGLRKILHIAVPAIFVVGAVIFGLLRIRPPAPALEDPQAASAASASSQAGVEASGMVRSNQSALLVWQATGTVGEVEAAQGQQVSSGQELAALSQSSLPPEIILAQAEQVSAQRALDELMTSKLKQAEALKAVEDAQKALDDLRSPQVSQAEAEGAIAQAHKEVDRANLQVYILTEPPSQDAIDKAHATMRMAENKLNNTRKRLERMQNQLKKVRFFPAPFRPIYRRLLTKAIENLEIQVNRDQIAYDRQVDQYEKLLAPADPVDLGLAQADLEKARAQLAEAQRAWERIKDGPEPAEIAAAEARLADARREWERLKDGPDPGDLAAAKARVAATKAALSRARITAPFEGQVTIAGSRPGDLVEPGTLAFRLDDLSRLLVDLQVSQMDINAVRAGQPVRLTFDAAYGKEYRGRVVEVAPVGTETEGVVNFLVTVELDDADQQVKPGMTASAEIIID
jgi:HlyD family secretion protein